MVVAAALANAGAAESIDDLLAHKEQRLEKLWSEYWNEDYRAAQGDIKASTKHAQAAIRRELTDRNFVNRLRKTLIADGRLALRRKIFLSEAARAQVAGDHGLAKLVDEISRRETAFRFRVGERTLTRAELATELQKNPDRDRRRAAWVSRAQLAPLIGDAVRRAIRLRNDISLRYAGLSYADSALARADLGRQQLTEWFEEILSATEAPYKGLIGRMQKEMGTATIEPWDFDFFFASLVKGPEIEAFQPAEAWARDRPARFRSRI